MLPQNTRAGTDLPPGVMSLNQIETKGHLNGTHQSAMQADANHEKGILLREHKKIEDDPGHLSGQPKT